MSLMNTDSIDQSRSFTRQVRVAKGSTDTMTIQRFHHLRIIRDIAQGEHARLAIYRNKFDLNDSIASLFTYIRTARKQSVH